MTQTPLRVGRSGESLPGRAAAWAPGARSGRSAILALLLLASSGRPHAAAANAVDRRGASPVDGSASSLPTATTDAGYAVGRGGGTLPAMSDGMQRGGVAQMASKSRAPRDAAFHSPSYLE